MNLMDMLSADPPSSIYGNELDQPALYTEGEGAAAAAAGTATAAVLDDGIMLQQTSNKINNNGSASETNSTGVYYIPTSLTDSQIVLARILLHLISETLITEVKSRRKKTSIDSLLEVSSMSTTIGIGGDGDPNVDSKLRNLQLVSTCLDNLLIIDNHPSLLVNHFMPKRLLLLQPTSSQALMSGKLQFFNHVVDSILDKNRTNGDEFYPILVVARNNKELELIEGLIIGKDLTYKNTGNKIKLYDDKRGMSAHDADNPKGGVYLNLIQTQQLYNNYMNQSTSSSYKFIFSFDFKIDATNPSIEMLRLKHVCPIFVPIPVYSIEHLMLQITEPSGSGFGMDVDINEVDNIAALKTNPKQVWKLKLLNTLAVNFTKFSHNGGGGAGWNSETFYYDNYGIMMTRFLENVSHPQRIANLFSKFDNELVLHFSDDRLLKKLNLIYDKQIFGTMELGHPLTVDNFQYQFAELLAFKLRQMSIEMENLQGKEEEGDAKEDGEKEVSIGQKRLLTTSKQVHFDEDENTIAESYHKLRRLNDDANIIDRKLARVENDLHKSLEKDAELENKLKQVQSITENNVSQLLLSTQSNQISTSQTELKDLQQEYERLSRETEDSRVKYQQSSSEAVIEMQKRTSLQNELNKINNRMQSPGMALLPDLIHKDTILTDQHRLDRLRHQNKFLELFVNDQLGKLLAERQLIMESTSGGSSGMGAGAGGISTGSSSRPSNRISRDPTPF